MPAGRPTKYRPGYCKLVVEHMQEGASLTSFAASIGVSRATLNVWCDEYPEFLEAVREGKARCAAWWEDLARKNAEKGTGNATLTIFGLKNMAPDDWREKQEIEQKTTLEASDPLMALLNTIAESGRKITDK